MTSTKLVQLGMPGGQPGIVASWCIKHASPLSMIDVATVQSKLNSHCESLASLRRLFTGQHCAVALPFALSHLRMLEVPVVADSERANLIVEEMLAELECDNSSSAQFHASAELSIDSWPSRQPAGQDGALASYAAYAVSRNLADSVGKSLLKARLHCQAIDAVPCALARAVQMLGFRRTEDAVLAVDLSHHVSLVVLVVRGNPIYVRPLRDVGMVTIEQPLREEFKISPNECHHLLSRFGVPASDQGVVTNRTMQIIHQPVNGLIEELKRTVTFARQQFAAHKPTQVCLFGGGASIRNLPERISHALGLPVCTWSLRRSLESNRRPDHGLLEKGDNEIHPSEAIFGLAAGLAALAWEDQLCM